MPKLPDQAYLRECFDYDPETGVLTWKERPVEHFNPGTYQRRNAAIWNAKYADKPAGWCGQGYMRVAIDYRYYLTHRIIWKLMTDREPKIVDHKDNNPLNNRLDNLRPATKGQNGWNSRGWGNRSLPKGVSWDRGKWKAQVTKNRVHYHLGRFATVESAKAAYDEAIIRLHGKFAKISSHEPSARSDLSCSPGSGSALPTQHC